ncbi:hypothetical protein SB6412_00428 [Klebsiella pasteurii]|nr:hypothetical protein SB6412_00428 [Klebsiella pasteurii]
MLICHFTCSEYVRELNAGGLFTDFFTEYGSEWICAHLKDEYQERFLTRKTRILDTKKARFHELFLQYFMQDKIKIPS